jgi:hypothetical protein
MSAAMSGNPGADPENVVRALVSGFAGALAQALGEAAPLSFAGPEEQVSPPDRSDRRARSPLAAVSPAAIDLASALRALADAGLPPETLAAAVEEALRGAGGASALAVPAARRPIGSARAVENRLPSAAAVSATDPLALASGLLAHAATLVAFDSSRATLVAAAQALLAGAASVEIAPTTSPARDRREFVGPTMSVLHAAPSNGVTTLHTLASIEESYRTAPGSGAPRDSTSPTNSPEVDYA